MSELQIALVGFGVVLIVVVWGYNLWQERKQRRQAEAALPAVQDDVLMAGRSAEAASLRIDEAAVLREPTFHANTRSVASESRSEDGRPAVAVPDEWSDGCADCLLRIEFVDPVSVSALWAEYATWSPRVGKPVQWLGLDERTARWRNLLPQDPGAVSQIAVALQLVDRSGPVDEVILKSFLQDVHRFAQGFSGLVELPDTSPILAQALELDAFCASVDLQLALHVLPRQGSLAEMPGAKLGPVIETAGLKLEGERFVAMDADGAEVFSLTCEGATAFPLAQFETQALTLLTFSLDVPRVAEGAAAFDQMIGFARRCADALGGQVADPQHKPLADVTISAIRKRINELQAQMAGQGIPAGSLRALRLFS